MRLLNPGILALIAIGVTFLSSATAQRVNVEPGTIPDVAALKLPHIERHAPVDMKELKFTVDGGRIGMPRTWWPVRFAVPVPRGELASTANVALKDPKGEPVTVQARATCYWPEGEVKWLLLEFLCNLPETGRADYTLVYGTKVAPAAGPRIKLTETPAAVTVDTEALKFTVEKGTKFLHDFTVENKRVGDLSAYLDYSLSPVAEPEKMTPEQRAKIPLNESEPAKESLHSGLAIDSVNVVEKGPVQVTLQLDGSYTTETVAHPVRLYVTAWAGRSLVQIKHSIVYAGYPVRDMLRGYGLDLSLEKTPADAAFGIEKGQPVRGHALVQKDDRTLLLDGKQQDARSAGWMDAGSVALSVQDLWRNYPVTLGVTPTGIRAALYGPESGGFLDLRYRVNELTNTYDGGGWCSARGIQKTHTVMLRFGGAFAEDLPAALLGPALDLQPAIVLPPKYVTGTGALGLVSSYEDDEALGRLKNAASLCCDWAIYAADLNRWYGFVNNADLNASPEKPVGDRLPFRFDGGIGWSSGNNIVSAFFIHYLLTGERKYFDFGSRYAQHKVDIDFEHVGGDGEGIEKGAFSRHNQIHWRSGGEPRQAPIQCLIRKYWLTGDLVTLDAVKMAMEWLERPSWGSAGALDTTKITFHCKAGAVYWPCYLYSYTVNDPKWRHSVKPFARALIATLGEGRGIGYQTGIIPVDGNGIPNVSEFRGTGAPGGYFFTYDAHSPLVEECCLTGDPEIARALLTLAAVMRQNPASLAASQDYYTYDRFFAWVYEATGDTAYLDAINRYRLAGNAGWINCKGTPQEIYTTQSLLKELGPIFSTGTNNLGLRLTALKEMPCSTRAYLAAKELPRAVAGVDLVACAAEGGKAKVHLDASASAATAGRLVSYEWSADEDGKRTVLAKTAAADVSFRVGKHRAVLMVTDDKGRVACDYLWVTVFEPGALRLNFQSADATAVSGYARGDLPFDGELGFGWEGKIESYRERYSPPRYGARLEGDGVLVQAGETKRWHAKVPNGAYRLAVGLGNVWDQKGATPRVRFEDGQAELALTLGPQVAVNVMSLPVNVADGELTMDAGGVAGVTYLTWLSVDRAGAPAQPYDVTAAIDSDVGPGTQTPQARLAFGASPSKPYVQATDVWDKPVSVFKLPVSFDGQIPVLETDYAMIPPGESRTFSAKLNTYVVRAGAAKKMFLDLGLAAPKGSGGAVSITADGKEQFRAESLPEGTVLRTRNLVAAVDDSVVTFTVTNSGKESVGIGYVRLDTWTQYVFIRKFSW